VLPPQLERASTAYVVGLVLQQKRRASGGHAHGRGGRVGEISRLCVHLMMESVDDEVIKATLEVSRHLLRRCGAHQSAVGPSFFTENTVVNTQSLRFGSAN